MSDSCIQPTSNSATVLELLDRHTSLLNSLKSNCGSPCVDRFGAEILGPQVKIDPCICGL